MNEKELRNDKSLQRLLLNKSLQKFLPRLKGRILDTGGKHSPYKEFTKYSKYEVLDISPDFNPDYVADVHDLSIISNSKFDAIIATELLEHCYNPQKVIDEFHRVLKKDGRVLLSVPFLYPYHSDPHDYYRYTRDGLGYLFRNYKKVEITYYGGRAVFFWEMMTWVLPFMKIFNKQLSKIKFDDKNAPSGIIVWAQK